MPLYNLHATPESISEWAEPQRQGHFSNVELIRPHKMDEHSRVITREMAETPS